MVKKLDPGLRETIREELIWIADFVRENSEIKNYGEINRLLHRLLDISV